MSHVRQAQWSQRANRLHHLRDHFLASGRHDRAYRAYLAIQHLVDRWADEMFASPGG
jgi:hypothetical protein